MEVVQEIAACRDAVNQLRDKGATIGLVPTMGALHHAHMALVEHARSLCDATVVTIFVNPTQFGPGEDLASYPRTLEDDLNKCRAAGVDIAFTPPEASMYERDCSTSVQVGQLTDHLCGPLRQGHFDGVATVVTKLFHIVPADVAFFGEKDFQQLQVIRRLVRDLNIPISVAAVPTVRDADGLAVSSRNVYLSDEQRRQATVLFRSLSKARDAVASGTRDSNLLIDAIKSTILQAGPIDIEYVEIVDESALQPIPAIDRPARICLAVRIGSCRLIDNVGVDVPM